MAVELPKPNKKPKKEKEKAEPSIWEKDIQLFAGSLNDAKKQKVYHDVATLLGAGMDVRGTLELLTEDEPTKAVREWMEQVREAVEKGQRLSKAIHDTGKVSSFEYHNIRIGEETGKLAAVFEELSSYFKARQALKKQLIGVLSYPAFIFSVTIGIVYFMLNYVVPMFSDVFARMGNELPALTQYVVAISDSMQTVGPVILIIISAIVAFFVAANKVESIRAIRDTILIRLPLIGTMVKMVYLNRFSRAMYLLLSSGTPIEEALGLVQNMIRFVPLEKALALAKSEIVKGAFLYEGMSKSSLFPKSFLSLIRVGEEVNRLEQMFLNLSDQYSEQVEHRGQVVGKLIEPIIIVMIGGVVGVILVAMYLPLFEIGSGSF